MARKIILVILALLVPGGLVALFAAAFASWARKRYQQRKATTNMSRQPVPIEAQDLPSNGAFAT